MDNNLKTKNSTGKSLITKIKRLTDVFINGNRILRSVQKAPHFCLDTQAFKMVNNLNITLKQNQ